MDSRSCPCTKSELDLFLTSPTQLAIEGSSFIEIHPVATISDSKAPIEFSISGSGEHYIDLSNCLLHVQAKIVNKDGSEIKEEDKVAPVNYFLHSMFSQCSVFLNDKQIASQINYAYRSFIEALLFSPKSVQESVLTGGLFYKDSVGEHNETDPTKENIGFNRRFKAATKSKLLDLFGNLHFDIGFQPKLLINGVNLRIKLDRSKDNFALMSKNDNYRIVMKHASLFIRKVDVSPSVILGHEKALEKGVIKIPIIRVDVKTFTLSKGLQSTTIANAFIGQLPIRVIIGFVTNAAYNGKIDENPFRFHHMNLNYISVLRANQMIPSKPYTPNFTEDQYVHSYLSLFTDLNHFHQNQNVNINYKEYKNGSTFYCFDLTPDYSAGEMHISIVKHGNLSLDLKFAEALSETINVIAFAEYTNTIEIDRARGVYTDY